MFKKESKFLKSDPRMSPVDPKVLEVLRIKVRVIEKISVWITNVYNSSYRKIISI